MSALCYRCAFCGREFANKDAQLFLDHMRACNTTPSAAPAPQKSEESESDTETTDNVTMETDTRSESSQQPGRRGRKPANLAAKRQPAVFLNRYQKSKTDLAKTIKPAIAKTPHSQRTPASVPRSQKNTEIVLSDAVKSKTINEILHGNRYAVVRMVNDPEIEKLLTGALNSPMKSVKLPQRLISKSSTTPLSSKSKVVGTSSVSNKESSGPTCKHCNATFPSVLEQTIHSRYCASGFVVGGAGDLCEEDSEEDNVGRAGSSGGHKVPEIPVNQQFCNYCHKQFQFWRNLRTHLLRACPERLRLFKTGKLPPNDQVQLADKELARKKQRVKEPIVEVNDSARNTTAAAAPIPWDCEYCKLNCADRAELLNHLRRCSRRLQMISDDELIAPEDQLNRLKRMHTNRGGPIGRPPVRREENYQKTISSALHSQSPAVPPSVPRTVSQKTRKSVAGKAVKMDVDVCTSVVKQPKKYECHKCHAAFSKESSFTRHMAEVCQNQVAVIDEKQCPGCRRTYPQTQGLKKHMMRYCRLKYLFQDLKTTPPGMMAAYGARAVADSGEVVQTPSPPRPSSSRSRRRPVAAAAAIAVAEAPSEEACDTNDVVVEPEEPQISDDVSREEVAASVEPPVGYEGEANLFTEEVEEPITDPDVLLAELAGIDPIGDDLVQKALHGAKLDIAPPPVFLPKGVKLVDVFDSNGTIFKVPYDTTTEPQTALMGVVDAIGRRQQQQHQPQPQKQQPQQAASSCKSPRPTSRAAGQVERRSVTPRRMDAFSPKNVPKQNILYGRKGDDSDDPDYDPREDTGNYSRKSPAKLPLRATCDEDFIASADWVRRQNASRIASGGRKVKVNSRYLE